MKDEKAGWNFAAGLWFLVGLSILLVIFAAFPQLPLWGDILLVGGYAIPWLGGFGVLMSKAK